MLADKVSPMRLDHAGTDEQAQRGEDPAQNPGDRRLARARRAGEDEVPGRRLAGEALPVAEPRHPQLGRDLVDLPLDRLKADQRIQLGQRARQRRRLAVAPEPAGQLGERVLQVGSLDGHEVAGRRLVRRAHDPDVPGLPGFLEQAAHEPAVAEIIRQPAPPYILEHPPEHRPGVGIQQLAASLKGGVGQREQLGRQVTGELDPDGEPRGEARVRGQEALHLLLVSGQDDDQVVPVVLGALEQRLDGLVAEPVTLPVALVDQAVRLVDEQHAAERRVDELVRLDRGRAEVLADQVGPVRLHHGGRLQQPERVEDLGNDPGDRGLPGARRAEEDEVLHGLLGAEPGQRAPAGRLDRRGNRPDLVLDRRQPDHGIELGHRLVNRDLWRPVSSRPLARGGPATRAVG